MRQNSSDLSNAELSSPASDQNILEMERKKKRWGGGGWSRRRTGRVRLGMTERGKSRKSERERSNSKKLSKIVVKIQSNLLSN